MATFTVIVERGDNLDNFERAFTEVVTGAMNIATEQVLSDAYVSSPNDRGFFRGSLQPDVKQTGDMQITGKVGSGVAHAGIVEGVDEEGNEYDFGRRPGTGFPPLDLLRAWVDRKGIAESITGAADWIIRLLKMTPEKRLDAMTYIIGRAIVQRGLPRPNYEHFRPMGRAAQKNLPFIEELFTKEVPEKLIARL